jgi:hypothetical protein
VGKGFGEVLFRFFVWDSAVSFDFMELSFLGDMPACGDVECALRNAQRASYLSIDSSRSSGSEVRVQGPRRRFGFDAVERDAIFRTKYGHVSA